MAFLQAPIQRKVSAMIGADVSFEHLNVSILGGSIDARGVRVAGATPDQPLLTIARVHVEMAIGRALKGEIVVKSVTVERPVLSIVRKPDGTLNLPKRLEDDPPAADVNVEAAPDDDAARGDDAGTPPADASTSRRVEVDKVLLVDGEVHFRDGAYHVSAERVLADLSRQAGGFDVTLIAESVARRDAFADLGTVKATGRLNGTEDVTRLATSSLSLDLDLAGRLTARVTSPSLQEKSGEATAHGDVDLATLRPFLPPPLAAKLAMLRGLLTLKVTATFDAKAGLTIPDLTLTAKDVGGIGGTNPSA